jgi:MtaA/CmuA family methyltransferase
MTSRTQSTDFGKGWSSRRRFLTALLGGHADRMAVGNVVSNVTLELMAATSAWFPRAHTDAQCMAALAAGGHEILGYDTVMPVFSVAQEASALGCEVHWGKQDMMPAALTHPFAGASEFRIPGGWMDAAAIQVVLDAISLLRKQLGDRVAIVGKVMGPWSLSYHLMGIEEFLVSTIDDPDRTRRCLDALKAIPVAFAQAQMRAGADLVCLADHATGGMVSPQAYEQLLLPIHQEIVPQFGGPVVLHCCGNTTDRVHLFARTGIDCYHLESQVDLTVARQAAAGAMRLMGNINNPAILLGGDPEAVMLACRTAIAGGIDILSPECAVPLTTPNRNLQALVQTAAGAA